MKEKIIKREVAGHTAYFFSYETDGGEMAFEFSMLCEVGEPYIPTFEQLVARSGVSMKTIEIGEAPWVITVAKPRFYECGICGHCHPWDWNADCRDDANRFTNDQLEAKHGEEGKDFELLSWEDRVAADAEKGG